MNRLNQPDFRKELNECLVKLKNLSDGMDHPDRMVFINEVIVRLLPERPGTSPAQHKALVHTRNPLQSLTSDHLELIRRLSDATDRLSGFNEGQCGC